MTSSLPMALMYGIRNFEYSYGYTKDGKIYYEEYFPNALKELYKGKHASLLLSEKTKICYRFLLWKNTEKLWVNCII